MEEYSKPIPDGVFGISLKASDYTDRHINTLNFPMETCIIEVWITPLASRTSRNCLQDCVPSFTKNGRVVKKSDPDQDVPRSILGTNGSTVASTPQWLVVTSTCLSTSFGPCFGTRA